MSLVAVAIVPQPGVAQLPAQELMTSRDATPPPWMTLKMQS
jgi:hypothetical protein